MLHPVDIILLRMLLLGVYCSFITHYVTTNDASSLKNMLPLVLTSVAINMNCIAIGISPLPSQSINPSTHFFLRLSEPQKFFVSHSLIATVVSEN